MDGQDVTNFSSSPHRLPTISASQALQESTEAPRNPISTGLPSLDWVVVGKSATPADPEGISGGLPCGQVTEIYGPPGAGKTVFSMHVASMALLAGNSVVWIDTACVMNARRLKNSLIHHQQHQQPSGQEPQDASFVDDCLEHRFHHFTAPTLPHLLALLIHPTPSFPPKGTTLLVVDSVSIAFNHAFAQSNRHDERLLPGRKSEVAQWASGRRWAVMGDLISAVAKLAAMRNMAVLLINQTTTKLQVENAAWLQPAMTGAAWDAGIHCRILLFRDWQMRTEDESSQESLEIGSDRGYAAVIKIGGDSVQGFGEIVPFAIDQYGLRETNVVPPAPPAIVMHEPTAPLPLALKRKRNEITDSASEGGDVISEDDDFGWVED